MTTAFVTAGGGFLLAVLWFDLMFDVQVARHRAGALPDEVLGSIAGYYRRVTTDARPMNRLVALAMLGTLAATIVQAAHDDAPEWVGWVSLALVVSAVAVAATHTFRAARRLGTRTDAIEEQSRLARSILRDHVFCLAAISTLLAIQLGFAA